MRMSGIAMLSVILAGMGWSGATAQAANHQITEKDVTLTVTSNGRKTDKLIVVYGEKPSFSASTDCAEVPAESQPSYTGSFMDVDGFANETGRFSVSYGFAKEGYTGRASVDVIVAPKITVTPDGIIVDQVTDASRNTKSISYTVEPAKDESLVTMEFTGIASNNVTWNSSEKKIKYNAGMQINDTNFYSFKFKYQSEVIKSVPVTANSVRRYGYMVSAGDEASRKISLTGDGGKVTTASSQYGGYVESDCHPALYSLVGKFKGQIEVAAKTETDDKKILTGDLYATAEAGAKVIVGSKEYKDLAVAGIRGAQYANASMSAALSAYGLSVGGGVSISLLRQASSSDPSGGSTRKTMINTYDAPEITGTHAPGAELKKSWGMEGKVETRNSSTSGTTPSCTAKAEIALDSCEMTWTSPY